jgi:hypothetical protein
LATALNSTLNSIHPTSKQSASSKYNNTKKE